MKMVALRSCSRAAGTRGRGYRNLTVILLSCLQSMQGLKPPSFFATKKLKAAGEVEETM